MVRRPLVVIGFWLVLAAILSLMLPSLQQMVLQRPVDILPANAPVNVATKQMTEAFHESGSQNVVAVVLTDEHGLGPHDEDVYRTLVGKLRPDTHDVVMLQDFISTPPLREVTTSKDHKAWFLLVGLAGNLGSPQGYEAYKHVANIVKHTVAGAR